MKDLLPRLLCCVAVVVGFSAAGHAITRGDLTFAGTMIGLALLNLSWVNTYYRSDRK